VWNSSIFFEPGKMPLERFGLAVFRASKLRLAVVAVVGSGLILYILKSVGLQSILLAATAVGWRGFAILCLYQLPQFVVLGVAWHALIPAAFHARLAALVWARMVRDATSELLPFSHVGGIVLGARAATAQGVPQHVVFGSIVTDITAEMLAQIAFIAVGVVILMTVMPQALTANLAPGSAAMGLMAVVAGCGAFVAFQRYGQALTIKLISRLFPNAARVTESAVECIQEIYRRPVKVAVSILFHCAAWVASALSTWIALLLMGAHTHVWPVLAIESFVCAARSAAFWMPNGLGVQELAYAAIAPLFGLGAETGLAISLLKRTRDIAVGLPILLLWQWSEGRRFLRTNERAALQRMR
jgi:putative membrane protein